MTLSVLRACSVLCEQQPRSTSIVVGLVGAGQASGWNHLSFQRFPAQKQLLPGVCGQRDSDHHGRQYRYISDKHHRHTLSKRD